MGVWGPKGYKFIKEVGKLISDKTKERRSTSFVGSLSQWRYREETVESPKLFLPH